MAMASGGPGAPQSIPKESEWSERRQRFFSTDPGWSVVQHEYPPGSPYSWVRGSSGTPSPLPCGEIPLKSMGGLTTLGTPPGSAEWWYLLAGLLVLRGMVVEQRGLGYAKAKSWTLDLLDARAAYDAHCATPPGGRTAGESERLSRRLHDLFHDLVGTLAQVDRNARYSLRTEAQAKDMVEELLSTADDAWGPDGTCAKTELLASLRADLVAALVESPDWQTRALTTESRLENAEYLLGGQIQIIRELAGPEATSFSDVRNRMESLEGERLAAEQRRDEMAAHVLEMRDFLGRIRSNELPEDAENVHHSIMASPRSRETEAVAQAYIDRRVEARFGERITEAATTEAVLRERVLVLKETVDQSMVMIDRRDTTIGLQETELSGLRRGIQYYRGVAITSGITVGLIGLSVVAALLHSAL